ncbi:MAG: vgb 2 [Bacteroidetes bacterium]|nr:vgb 2 [Bacteroidota bacterium]
MKRHLIGILIASISAAVLLACKSDAPTTSDPPPTPGATHLALTGVPNPIAAGATFVLTVRALRDGETVDPNFIGNVTVVKASGPGALNGTVTKSAVAGVAIFNDLSLSATGTITLRASSGTLPDATTGSIAVVPASGGGPATKLQFMTLPTTIIVDSAFSATVHALRADNSLDSAYTGTVAILLDSGPGILNGATTHPATNGIAFFPGLALTAPGAVTLRANSGTLTTAISQSIAVNSASPTVLRVGTFNGQNGYSTSGSLQILRQTNGTEVFMTGTNFSVSGGAGSIGVWLTNSTGATNLNSTTVKIRLATITSGFSGVYTFTIPGGLGNYTHAVTFCESANINFGNAQLTNP